MTKTDSRVRQGKISDFTPDPHNANKGTERGRRALDDSLRTHGAGRSILADKNGIIIAGNKTAETAVDIGLEDAIIVPTDGTQVVVVQRTDIDINTPEGRALAYRDNKIAADDLAWSAEQIVSDLQMGLLPEGLFDVGELEAIIASTIGEVEPPGDPGAQLDRAEELREKWQVERGQVWQIGKHRLMCGDSTSREDVDRLMDGAKAEMVWTDPPYGVSVGDKNKFLNSIAPSNRIEENLTNDTLDEKELSLMLCGAFDCAIEHCTAGGAWYVAAPPGPLHVLFGQALKDRGIWRQTITWVKNNATFSPMGVDYHWRAEPIFYGWLPNAGHRYYGGRQQDTVWNIDRPMKSPEHPTMKPVELVARAVNNSSCPDQIVYDAFVGSGTTLVACEQTGRIGYGMELEPKYAAVTLQRLADMGLAPQLLSTESTV